MHVAHVYEGILQTFAYLRNLLSFAWRMMLMLHSINLPSNKILKIIGAAKNLTV